ncbi:sensor histidine kinase [Brevibacillus laterosporus]|uniref:histidine kinase n=1 Tax=Brevibacillus laterosporus TaxID=1465 RepID=A0A502HWD0_BRELA|nr:sensor histidine kinase [Brevibacillus laterosporus]QDX93523.1 sensor histidine kinase [Brevibacillus laterosporus]TPG73269.1 sensor histidine kinase [Brevibacillus laterosporus]TPG77652.1 sensor histidine kinase [Brevibacillus laterosporus]
MKLFFREHLRLIFFQVFQLLFILFILLLDGYVKNSVLIYMFVLSIGLLAIYLFITYIRSREFYLHLEKPMETLEDSLVDFHETPISEAYAEAMQSQYRMYQQMILEHERKKDEHVTFMNQWVHQMKTPLSVIQLLVQDEDESPFPSLREEADRIGRGLEMVLHTSRLEVFERDFQVDSVELKPIVQRVIQENKTYFIRNQVYPDVQIAEGIYVKSDTKWLPFMLDQIITNAIKYSAGSKQKITISAIQRDKEVVLEIIDRGIGIPEADIKRVFRPFFTGENGRKYRESTGMGLYLVQQISEKLEHQVNITSKVGEGTTVLLIFPCHVMK